MIGRRKGFIRLPFSRERGRTAVFCRGRAAPSPPEGPYCRSIDGLAPANARKTGRLRSGGGLEGSPPPPVGTPFIRHPTDHIYECTGRE